MTSAAIGITLGTAVEPCQSADCCILSGSMVAFAVHVNTVRYAHMCTQRSCAKLACNFEKRLSITSVPSMMSLARFVLCTSRSMVHPKLGTVA